MNKHNKLRSQLAVYKDYCRWIKLYTNENTPTLEDFKKLRISTRLDIKNDLMRRARENAKNERGSEN